VSAAEILAAARRGARRVEAGFSGPDEDWVNVILAARGERLGPAIACLWQSEAEREALIRRQIPAALRRLGADGAAIVLSGWFSLDALASGGRAAEAADAREALIITGLTATETALAIAWIERRPGRPPRLGAWREHPEIVPASPWIDAVRAGIG
jgi:hypothetical protein